MRTQRDRGAGRLARLWRCSGGQAAVEFAFAAPVVLALFVGIIEMGQLFYTRVSMRHIAQQATRFAVTGQVLNDPKTGKPMTRAISLVSLIRSEAQGLQVAVDSVTLDPRDGGKPGDVVRVTVHYRYDLGVAWLRHAMAGAPDDYTVSVAMKNEPIF